MKHSLHILGEPGDTIAAKPVIVSIGTKVLSIEDAHDGVRARELGARLVEAGGRVVAREDVETVDLRIAVRSTPKSKEARLRSEVLEETAHLVLGSARPVFARRLVEALESR